MNYIRVYTDDDGETHFEDVTVPGQLRQSSVSQSQSLVSELIDADGVIFRRVVVEHETDRPHVAPRRQFVVHLQGEAEIEASDGEVRHLGPGSVVLVEDTHGKGHTTRKVGDVDRVTLFIPLP